MKKSSIDFFTIKKIINEMLDSQNKRFSIAMENGELREADRILGEGDALRYLVSRIECILNLPLGTIVED